MIPQAKLLRVFKLIRLLNQQPGHTISYLAGSLDLTERSVYRYIQFLDSVGYAIDCDPRTHRYFLFGTHDSRPGAFTEEENDLIRQALAGVSDASPLLSSIRQKLFLSSTLVPLADGLVDTHQGQIVGQLAQCIRDKVQVWLLGYHSTNSGTVSDRLVEPLAFREDYAILETYENSSDTVKFFKTKRIEAIRRTDLPARQLSVDTVQDMFTWTGPCWLPVTLHLTDRAYRLFIEEYPLARPDTFERADSSPFRYGWRGRVRDWRGIGRFVLGLPGEVQVADSDDFRAYLRNRQAEATY